MMLPPEEALEWVGVIALANLLSERLSWWLWHKEDKPVTRKIALNLPEIALGLMLLGLIILGMLQPKLPA